MTASSPPTAYAAIVARSERATWRLDSVLPPDATLDRGKRLLPESIAGVEELTLLQPAERTLLNQIRGNSYVHLFTFLEDSVIASIMRHATAAMFGDDAELRALLRFAEEEVKHQELFRRFRAMFDRTFGLRSQLVGSAQEVAGFVLDRSPLAVMLVNYHFELITQQHYMESVRDEAEDLEPHFKAMLKAHWMEEAQHAAIDALKVEELSTDADPAWLERSLVDYEEIVMAFDRVLAEQAGLDVATLVGALGDGRLAAEEQALIRHAQHRAYRRSFLTSGLRHALIARSASRLAPDAVHRLNAIADKLDAPG